MATRELTVMVEADAVTLGRHLGSLLRNLGFACQDGTWQRVS